MGKIEARETPEGFEAKEDASGNAEGQSQANERPGPGFDPFERGSVGLAECVATAAVCLSCMCHNNSFRLRG